MALTTDTLEWTDEMRDAARRVSLGENLFITGRAGTGKSTLLDLMRASALPRNTMVVAPTGVAAQLVGGMTVHRAFGLMPNTTLEQVATRDWGAGRHEGLESLQCLVIDEVSMVRADLLDKIDLVLRRFGPARQQPFGGVQLVAIGDLRQLPPVLKDAEKPFFERRYASPYFIDAHLLREIEMNPITLTRTFRQDSEGFIAALNGFRDGRPSARHLDLLNGRVRAGGARNGGVRLVPTRAQAARVNETELSRLKTPRFRSRALTTGQVPVEDRPTQDVLEYAVGARIMMVKNDVQGRWVNGTLATIMRCQEGTAKRSPRVWIQIDGTEGVEEVGREIWPIYAPTSVGGHLEYEEIGSFEQLPFQLAWAITVHKSQGKSFDKVTVDFASPPFAAGQAYVALSRARRLSGLTLTKPLVATDAMIDPVVTAYLEAMEWDGVAA